ncbi:MAG TPA: hypothetical protein VIL92_09390 [Gaiellaceae bacterium]|jgi:hypothetical protein
MPEARTPEQIRGELDAERTELAGAVEHLRSEVGGKLKKLPIAAGAAASIGLALAATKRYFARRRD